MTNNILATYYPGLHRFNQEKFLIESSGLPFNKVRHKFGFIPLSVPDNSRNQIVVPNLYINRHGLILSSKPSRYNPDCDYHVYDYTIDKDLYNRFGISLLGKHRMYFMHRLVAFNFLPNPQNYKEVNHIDRDITNCDVSNLEWCSYEQNMRHARETNNLRISLPDGVIEQYEANNNGQLKLLRTYASVKEVPTILSTCGSKISRQYIRKCCLNNLKDNKAHTYHGYIWKFKNINIS